MTDIWEQRVSGRGAVMHGSATLFIAWKKVESKWMMLGSFWNRAAAEAALAGPVQHRLSAGATQGAAG